MTMNSPLASSERKRPPKPDRFLADRYWNTGKVGICVVAIEGVVGDWAAYIGAAEPLFEEDAINAAYEHGVKLTKQEAEALFLDFGFTKRLYYRT